MLREKELALLENLKTDNEKKTEEIRQLRNNQLVGQASGEEIVTITDGALAFANILEETEIEVEGAKRKAYVVKLPQGLSKQKVRQGYNSAKYDKETQTISEIKFTHNDDNSMKVNGTSTNYVTFKLNQEPITLKAGTYTLAVLYDKTIESGIDIHFDIRDNETSIGNILKSIYMTTNANSWKTSEITLEKETDVNLVYYVINGATVENQTVKFMLLEGTYTAENLPEYEEYGESPSIEFPSPIKNIRAWNLFNAYIPKQNIGGVDVEFDEDTGVLTLNGTCTETKQISFDRSKNKIKTKANTKYTFEVFKVSGKYTFGGTSEHGESSVQLWDNSSGTWKYPYQLIFNSFGSANKIFVSHTYDVDILYNQVQFKLEAGDVFDDFKIKIQFTEGDSKEYLPCGDIFINMKNKNYVSSDINDWEEGHYSQTTGLKEPYANRLRLKEPIKVQPDTACYANTFSNNTYNLVLREYDKYKNIINNIGGATDGGIFTTTKDTQFISVSLYNRLDAGEPLYFSDFKKLFEDGIIKPFMCLNSEINKEYVSHKEQSYNLHISDLELNGINNVRDSLVIELEDENMSDKKIKKLYLKKFYDKIDNFTGLIKDFTSSGSNERAILTIDSNFKFSHLYENPGLSNILKPINNGQTYSKVEGFTVNVSDTYSTLYMYIDEYKSLTAEEYIEKLNELGAYFILPLQNPELIDITDNVELVKDVEYLINNLKTFEEITHVELQNGYVDLEYIKSTELAFKNMQQQIDNIQAVMLEGGTNNA